jgi:hypothetical protein
MRQLAIDAGASVMHHSLALLGFVLLLFQTRDPIELEPGRVEQAVTALKLVFEKGAPADRRAAIVEHAQVVEPKVIALFAKALKDSDPQVRDAAAQALRFARHPDALTALQEALKRELKTGKLGDERVRLIKCVGQHQSASSIPLLVDDPFRHSDGRVLEAQVYALANTRTPKALEELIGMLRTASREKVQPHMHVFRLALIVITGVDQGLSQDAWMAWWNDNKQRISIPAQMPALPKEMLDRWNAYWGLEYVLARPKKRGDRGDDSESGK